MKNPNLYIHPQGKRKFDFDKFIDTLFAIVTTIGVVVIILSVLIIIREV